MNLMKTKPVAVQGLHLINHTPPLKGTIGDDGQTVRSTCNYA